jgi:DNA-binding Xre family transcriptional regulator
MSQNRKPRGICATENGYLKLQEAKSAGRDEDGQPLTFEKIALKAGVNERTVRRLFNRDGIDKDSGFAICEALGLKPTEILELNPRSEEPDRKILWFWVCPAPANLHS